MFDGAQNCFLSQHIKLIFAAADVVVVVVAVAVAVVVDVAASGRTRTKAPEEKHRKMKHKRQQIKKVEREKDNLVELNEGSKCDLWVR